MRSASNIICHIFRHVWDATGMVTNDDDHGHGHTGDGDKGVETSLT